MTILLIAVLCIWRPNCYQLNLQFLHTICELPHFVQCGIQMFFLPVTIVRCFVYYEKGAPTGRGVGSFTCRAGILLPLLGVSVQFCSLIASLTNWLHTPELCWTLTNPLWASWLYLTVGCKRWRTNWFGTEPIHYIYQLACKSLQEKLDIAIKGNTTKRGVKVHANKTGLFSCGSSQWWNPSRSPSAPLALEIDFIGGSFISFLDRE